MGDNRALNGQTVSQPCIIQTMDMITLVITYCHIHVCLRALPSAIWAGTKVHTHGVLQDGRGDVILQLALNLNAD